MKMCVNLIDVQANNNFKIINFIFFSYVKNLKSHFYGKNIAYKMVNKCMTQIRDCQS